MSKRRGLIVKTASGKYGIAYSDDPPVNVNGVNKASVTVIGVDSPEEGVDPKTIDIATGTPTGQKILCSPGKLKVIGFID